MNPLSCVLFAGLIVAAITLTSCAPRRAMRVPASKESGGAGAKDGASDTQLEHAWYIESTPPPGQRPISCSFVEFDERGDYLKFQQHVDAWHKIKNLTKSGERLLLIIYVHGWKNNSQSGDVVQFNHFLGQIAASPLVTDNHLRVHGVYLAWRGNAYKHALDSNSEEFAETEHLFGGKKLVDPSYARKPLFGWLLWAPEQLSYWSRKGAAEDKVSSVALNRTILTCAQTARRYSQTNAPNKVFLMGHSFGALMLERSFAPASLAHLVAEWPLDDEALASETPANPLPFDLVLLVNSAAPSIYAKEFHDFMVANRSATAGSGVVGADAPLVISLTSEADWATGIAHRWANAFARLNPSLWRSYDGRGDFILAMPSNAPPVKVPQAYYYQHTPGHNPLLVNHWIVPAKDDVPDLEGDAMRANMDLSRKAEVEAGTFHTTPARKNGKPTGWRITTTPPDPKWSSYHGYKPVFLEWPVKSGYWIVRCQKEIISGHNDVWNKRAMETYAALLRQAEFLRTQPSERRKPSGPTGATPEPPESKVQK